MTGATGFIGSRAVRALLAKNADVVALQHRSASTESSVDVIKGDLGTGDGFSELLQGARVLVHCASYIGDDERLQERVNITGTAHLVEAAEHAGVERIVYLSTSAVYGGGIAGGTEDELLVAPGSSLSASRRAAEQAVLRAGGVVVRPHAVVGAGDRWFLLSVLAATVRFNAWIEGGESRVSVANAAQVGDALALLGMDEDCPRGAVFHSGGPEPVRLRGLIEPVLRSAGCALPTQTLSGDHLRRVADQYGISRSQLAMVAQDNWFDARRLLSRYPQLAQTPELSASDIGWYVSALRASIEL
ncbi:MAG: NAD-dependent epimerase/dehydratase family protein [Microbacterium sp.]|uniref:NAD-dependent epimerase/dehydratase family protein n=1 Tax=Microbacterium sp. TaxID=51671 RepID=UPI001ACE47B5|nr:NAD-dependent epimerase/dehydratase family protein [Microbacterium sp.]MBN9177853.1 NAD-dependent epimerase/dehydratase family protein [Microbacterium sp.]